MKANQGLWERALRVGIGTAATGAGYAMDSGPAFVPIGLMLTGAILIGTGLVAYCPAWHILGISTKRSKPD